MAVVAHLSMLKIETMQDLVTMMLLLLVVVVAVVVNERYSEKRMGNLK
jgi:hypothetical protein